MTKQTEYEANFRLVDVVDSGSGKPKAGKHWAQPSRARHKYQHSSWLPSRLHVLIGVLLGAAVSLPAVASLITGG